MFQFEEPMDFKTPIILVRSRIRISSTVVMLMMATKIIRIMITRSLMVCKFSQSNKLGLISLMV